MKNLLIPMMLLFLVITGCQGVENEVTISQFSIQKMVEKKFPIEKRNVAANIKLFSPRIFFQGDSLGLSLQYSMFVLLGEMRGSIAFKGKPVYKPEQASFYMNDFVMTKFTVDNFGSIENDRVTGLISTLVNTMFNDYPLYKLNQDNFKQNLALMVLKSVTVKDNDLVLLMGF